MAADQENNFCFASNEVYLYVVFLFIWIINKTWVHALKWLSDSNLALHKPQKAHMQTHTANMQD